jgi:hypothetical protein
MAAKNIGKDRRGGWLPGYMTHAELKRALRANPYDSALAKEAKGRMKSASYPRFPADIVWPEE